MGLLPRRYAGKVPTWPYALNDDSPMAIGLTHLVGYGGINLVNNQVQTSTGAVGMRNDGLVFTGTGSYLTLTNAVLQFVGPKGEGSTVAIWFSTQQTTNFNLIGRNTSSVYIGSQSTSNMLFYDGIVNNTLPLARDGNVHVAAWTVGGARSHNYVGVDTTPMTDASNDATSYALDRVGYDAGTGDQLNGTIYGVGVWARAITDYEFWTLSDPSTRWDLFWQPNTRAYSFMSAAAAFDATQFPHIPMDQPYIVPVKMVPSGRVS